MEWVKAVIKEEPMEYSEMLNDSNSSCCCLCEEGNKILNKLSTHIKESHVDDIADNQFRIDSCSCPDGLRWQTDLINHMLSHIAFDMPRDFPEFKTEAEISEEPKSPVHLLDKLKVESDNDPNESSEDVDEFSEADDPTEFVAVNLKTNFTSEMQCSKCFKKYKTASGFANHEQMEHDPSNSFACTFPSCQSRFKNKVMLTTHRKYHFFKDGFNEHSQPICPVCSKFFKTRKILLSHMKVHLRESSGKKSRSDKTGKVMCDQCTEWLHPNSMKMHIFNRHNKESQYMCDLPGCNTSFLYPSGLQNHKDHHEGIKKHSCEFCGKTFSENGNLKEHLLRHTDPERFKCKICSKKYVNDRALRLHMRTHEEDDGSRPFACDECDKAYRFENWLKDHKRKLHAPRVDMPCDICSFVGYSRTSLSKHRYRVHQIKTRNKSVFDNDAVDNDSTSNA